MKRLIRPALFAAGVLAGVAGGITAARRFMSRRAPSRTKRWLVVTVNAEPDRVEQNERVHELFREFGGTVETRVAPAPAGRGTELAAWPHTPSRNGVWTIVRRITGKDPRQPVRRALRRAKSLVETGEVLRPDEPTTEPGLGGKAIELVTRRSGGEGRL